MPEKSGYFASSNACADAIDANSAASAIAAIEAGKRMPFLP
jgi:hypothetical protein